MPVGDALLDLLYADAADPAGHARKIKVNHLLCEPDPLEDPRGLVGLDRGDPHLGRNLHDTVKKRPVVIVDRRVGILVEKAQRDQLLDALVGEIGVDRPGPESEDAGRLVDIPHLAALEDQRYGRPLSRADQVLLHRRDREQCRDRHMVLVNAPVREDDDVGPSGHGPVHRKIQVLNRLREGGVLVVEERDGFIFKAAPLHGPYFQHVDAGQDRVVHLEDRAVAALRVEKVAVGADVDGRVRDDLLPEGVDRRVRDLGELLLEEAVEKRVGVRERCQRDVMPHGDGRLRTVCRGLEDVCPHLLIAVAEHLVEAVPLFLGMDRHLAVRDREVIQMHQVRVDPLPVGMGGGVVLLALLIRDDALPLRVDEQHSSGHES